MTDAIRITKTTAKKDKPKDKDLAFGNVFTDHIFVANFQEEKGWYDPRVEPYAPIPMDPATAVLHYGQSLFEGLKAVRCNAASSDCLGPKHVDRPQPHAERSDPTIDPDSSEVVDYARPRRRVRGAVSVVGPPRSSSADGIASEPFPRGAPRSILYYCSGRRYVPYSPKGSRRQISVDHYVRAVAAASGG